MRKILSKVLLTVKGITQSSKRNASFQNVYQIKPFRSIYFDAFTRKFENIKEENNSGTFKLHSSVKALEKKDKFFVIYIENNNIFSIFEKKFIFNGLSYISFMALNCCHFILNFDLPKINLNDSYSLKDVEEMNNELVNENMYLEEELKTYTLFIERQKDEIEKLKNRLRFTTILA